MESDNKTGSRNCHDGFVYDDVALDWKKRNKSSEETEELNCKELIAFKYWSKEKKLERIKKKFKYIRCHESVQVGREFNRCKKEEHDFHNSKRRSFEVRITEKRMIDDLL